jgi:hypothetical protein
MPLFARRFFTFRALLTGLAMLVCSFVLHAGPKLTVPDSTVYFEAPDGFTPLTSAEIALKYPRGNPPKQVAGDARRTTSIAYDLKNNRIPETELEKGLAFFGDNLGKMIPGVVWKRKEIIELQGKRWIYLEMTSAAIDTDIYNIMLVTPHEGKTLMFNFNSTKEEFAKNELALRASLASIRLK